MNFNQLQSLLTGQFLSKNKAVQTDPITEEGGGGMIRGYRLPGVSPEVGIPRKRHWESMLAGREDGSRFRKRTHRSPKRRKRNKIEEHTDKLKLKNDISRRRALEQQSRIIAETVARRTGRRGRKAGFVKKQREPEPEEKKEPDIEMKKEEEDEGYYSPDEDIYMPLT